MEQEKKFEALALELRNFYPTQLDYSSLIEYGFINTKDEVDMASYYMSNMGLHIDIIDDHNTRIEGESTMVKISSNSIDKLISFYKMMVSQNFRIVKIGFQLIHHYSNEAILNNTMSQVSNISGLKAVEFRRNGIGLKIYECRSDRLHLALERAQEVEDLNDLRDVKLFIEESKSYLREITGKLKLDDPAI